MRFGSRPVLYGRVPGGHRPAGSGGLGYNGNGFGEILGFKPCFRPKQMPLGIVLGEGIQDLSGLRRICLPLGIHQDLLYGKGIVPDQLPGSFRSGFIA